MTDFLDFDGKNVDQAVEKACEALGVAKDQLSYDIISYGSTGIFGLVRTKKALIRVSAPRFDGQGESFTDTSGNETASIVSGEGEADDNRAAISALIDEAFGDSDAAGEDETAPPSDEGEDEDFEDLPEEHPPPATEEAIAVAKSVLSRILTVLSPEAEISVHQDAELCRMHISNGETAILIGRKGQTLEAMQYLLDKIVNKQCGKGYRILVDVEGYLETRQTELQEMASRMAEKACRTGKPATINRMNAHDRRVIHLALKNNRSVRTQSVGDGYYRKLMILPRRRKRSAKAGSRSRQSQ
jgi:spoIIIJ-associated protein